MADADEAEPRLEDLRRALYRPGATDRDRERYAALRAEADAAHGPAPAAPAAPGPDGRRRAALLAAAAAVALLGIGAAVLLPARRDAASTASPSRAAAATPAPVLSPSPFPVALDGRVVVAQEVLGSGDAVVPIDAGIGTAHGGRLLLAIGSSDPSPVGWRAERGSAARPLLVARGAPALLQGATAPVSAAYRGAPPTRVVVQAAEGVGWRLVVLLTPPATGRH